MQCARNNMKSPNKICAILPIVFQWSIFLYFHIGIFVVIVVVWNIDLLLLLIVFVLFCFVFRFILRRANHIDIDLVEFLVGFERDIRADVFRLQILE